MRAREPLMKALASLPSSFSEQTMWKDSIWALSSFENSRSARERSICHMRVRMITWHTLVCIIDSDVIRLDLLLQLERLLQRKEF